MTSRKVLAGSRGFMLVLIGWCGTAAGATFSQLALGGGYQCVLMISNKTATAWQGTASLKQGNNQAWVTPWSLNGDNRTGTGSFDVVLAAGGTAKYLLTGDASARAGYLVLNANSGFSATGVAVAFFYNASRP